MKKIWFVGQAALVAMVITTAGFTSVEAQSGSSNPSSDSFWDTVENPPEWIPKNGPHDDLNENPPLHDMSGYSKRRKNSGYIHQRPKASQSSRRNPKHNGYKHAKPGAFARCQMRQMKTKQAVEKIYNKHKETESHANCKMDEWHSKRLQEIDEAAKQCEELRSDPITKEAQVQQ